MTLYELVGDYKKLLELATDPDIEEDIFLDTLDSITGTIEVKADGYGKIMKSLEGNEAAIEAEIERLTRIKQVMANKRNRMKERLFNAMKELELTKVDTDLFKFRIQKNGGVSPLVITGDVPQEFKKVIIEDDNKKIRDYLKDHDCEWAHLGERGESLRIK